MAVSAAVKVRRDGTLVLESGGGSPVTLTVTYEDGNFSANTLGANEDRIVIRDRGSIKSALSGFLFITGNSRMQARVYCLISSTEPRLVQRSTRRAVLALNSSCARLPSQLKERTTATMLMGKPFSTPYY